MRALQIKKKDPRPDILTRKSITHHGKKGARTASSKSQMPAVLERSRVIPVSRKGKNKNKEERYRPVSVTNCVRNLISS